MVHLVFNDLFERIETSAHLSKVGLHFACVPLGKWRLSV